MFLNSVDTLQSKTKNDGLSDVHLCGRRRQTYPLNAVAQANSNLTIFAPMHRATVVATKRRGLKRTDGTLHIGRELVGRAVCMNPESALSTHLNIHHKLSVISRKQIRVFGELEVHPALACFKVYREAVRELLLGQALSPRQQALGGKVSK